MSPPSRLTAGAALELYEAQLWSRQLDLAARWLHEQGQGYYTIGSSGHEGNACVARALRPSDPAFLHYRSCAFFLERARQAGYPHAARDVLYGAAAARDEPIAGGRHKVFGNKLLNIPPQTSTIASHLPKAVGMAYALGLRGRKEGAIPGDAIVLASFGDASLNHSTAQGAINAACYLAHQGLPVPALFLCEDNGIGISVPTPPGWIEQACASRHGLRYFSGDGCDLASAFEAACEAAAFVRSSRRPALLHLRMVRLLGHAGSDVELAYRSPGQIRDAERRDPLLRSAELLLSAGALSEAELSERKEAIRLAVQGLAQQAASCRRLESAEEVMRPLLLPDGDALAAEARRPVDAAARRRFFEEGLPEDEDPAPLAAQLSRALADLLVKYPEALIFGEDVGRKGGVYGVTRGLLRRAGPSRVFDTLLDEQAILGFAAGAGHLGFLPVPEIQYLAYLHNAEDQLRGEAATLKFFSQGQFKNPMVVRIAAYGYQKGFGGHFHNDNSVAVLRDIPGLIIASPSRGDDAAAMLRTCMAAATVDGAVCVFLEPIALYGTRDLYEQGDGAWLTRYDPCAEHVPLGRGRTYLDGQDLLLVSFANGVPMSLRAARRLLQQGVRCTVLDLRWLAPLPVEDLLREASRTGRVLVVDETRRTGGVSEGVLAALVDGGFAGSMGRVASRDSFIPLGPAAGQVLISEEDIVQAARALLTATG